MSSKTVSHHIIDDSMNILFTATLVDRLCQCKMLDVARFALGQEEHVHVSTNPNPKLIASSRDLELLHKRLGHVNVEDLILGLKRGVRGYA